MPYLVAVSSFGILPASLMYLALVFSRTIALAASWPGKRDMHISHLTGTFFQLLGCFTRSQLESGRWPCGLSGTYWYATLRRRAHVGRKGQGQGLHVFKSACMRFRGQTEFLLQEVGGKSFARLSFKCCGWPDCRDEHARCGEETLLNRGNSPE
jgi:hypothetical protein